MKDGGWSTSEKGWVLHPSQVLRVIEVHRAAMERCDLIQTGYPVCALCGQRAIHLDRFGLCSKVSQTHQDWRAGVLADEKAGMR